MERMVTVEYLDQTMANELLCKFPDASSYDFDYSQSGIWSPLVPRNSYLVSPFSSDLKKPNWFMDGLEQNLLNKFKNTNMKTMAAMVMKKKKNKKKKGSFKLPATPVQGSITPKKGWCRTLKASSNYFKKQRGSSHRGLKSS